MVTVPPCAEVAVAVPPLKLTASSFESVKVSPRNSTSFAITLPEACAAGKAPCVTPTSSSVFATALNVSLKASGETLMLGPRVVFESTMSANVTPVRSTVPLLVSVTV